MPCYIYRCYFPPNRPTGLLFFHLPHLRQPQFRKPPFRRAESTTYPFFPQYSIFSIAQKRPPRFFYRRSPLRISTLTTDYSRLGGVRRAKSPPPLPGGGGRRRRLSAKRERESSLFSSPLWRAQRAAGRLAAKGGRREARSPVFPGALFSSLSAFAASPSSLSLSAQSGTAASAYARGRDGAGRRGWHAEEEESHASTHDRQKGGR